MKKKLFVFLTVILGGLFILLYNPLKEFTLSMGEVKAVETNAVAAEEYSEFEKFLMNDRSGTYKLTQDETITHDLNLSFTTETIKTIATDADSNGPFILNLILAADVIVGNNCKLSSFSYVKLSSSGGSIILKGNGSLSATPYGGNFNLDCIKCDSTSTGSLYFTTGVLSGTLLLDYGVDFYYGDIKTSVEFGENFNGSMRIPPVGGCTIKGYLGPKNKIKISAVSLGCFEKECIILSDTTTSKFDVVANKEEMAFYLVRKPIPKPTESTKIYAYNGNSQTYIPDGFDPVLMNISNNVQTNAGTYDVEISFKDTENQWSEGGSASFTLPFTINKTDFNSSVSMTDYTYGGTRTNPSIDVNPGSGPVTYYYSTSNTNTGGTAWSEVTSSTSLDAGTYYMYAIIGETSNYYGKTTSATPFEITKADITGIEFRGSTITYDKEMHSLRVTGTLPENVSVSYTLNGTPFTGASDVGSYDIKAEFTNNTTNYNDLAPMSATLIIEAKDVTVEFSNYNLVYNKGEQEITVNLKGIIDGDTCSIKTMTGNKGQYAGDYTCEVTEISNPNYALSGTTTLAWSIAKYQVEKPLEDTTVYIYTGEEQTYAPVNYDSTIMSMSNQTQTEAGTYTVTITLNDTANYEWEDGTIEQLEHSFTIQPKAVDIIWSENAFTYNGEEQDKSGIIAYYLTLPSSTKNYLTVRCNSESFKLAGTYTFSVELDDTKNYTVANSSDSHSYTIDKAGITLQAEDKSSAYGAALKELTYVVASGTIYHDEITPELSTTATTTSNAGAYPITITAVHNDNYDITLTNGTYTITKIDPRIITNPTVSHIYLGQILTNSILSGGEASVDGSFSWATPNTIPNVGEYIYEVIFTPTDSTNYNTETILVSVTVNELPKDNDGNVKVDDKNYEDVKSILDDYDKLPEEDKEKIDNTIKEEIIKIRHGLEDYQREHGIKTDPIILSNPSASKITYGKYLSSSNLSGGKANVEGEFTFSKPKLMPKRGIQAYEVVFTPTKNDIYNPIVFEVEVEVEDLESISLDEDKPIKANKDNYEELKKIVDNYNNLTEEEKNEVDSEVKEDILRIEKAIQKYEGRSDNLVIVLILSIGVPCGVILIAGIILYVVIRRKRKR